MATPKRLSDSDMRLLLKKRLNKCWNLDLNWTLYPLFLQQVRNCVFYSMSAYCAQLSFTCACLVISM